MSITCTWFLALLVRHPSCSQRSHLKPDSLTLARPQELVFRTKQSPARACQPNLRARYLAFIIAFYFAAEFKGSIEQCLNFPSSVA
jgi:hypothetical protein